MKASIKNLSAIALGVLSFSISAAELTRDEAQIRSNINGYAALADQGAYQHLGRLFADKLVVDYTSLWGGEPATVSNVDLMKQWSGFLPGFDTTYHDLSNLNVQVEGDKATASVDFTASHYLADGHWQVSGSYEYKLNRANDNWVINSVKLNYKDEAGSRDVLGEAPKHAVKNLAERDSHLITLD